MAVLGARSHNEAMVYVMLRDCGACGEQIRDITDELSVHDGRVRTQYTAACQRCGSLDTYVFDLAERDPQSGEPGVVYGGADPSAILDAGDWLGFADRLATGGPVEPAGLTPDEREAAALSMTVAAAAVREVLKVIPPGTDTVPLTAVGMDRGWEEFGREPGQMRRSRMEVLAAAYQEAPNGSPVAHRPSRAEMCDQRGSSEEWSG
jgi:hypothetical protein